MIEILGQSLHREGDRYSLFASPRYIRLDGATWQPLESLITRAEGGYDITGPSGCIHIRPQRRPAGALLEAVVRGVHFGDRIDVRAVDSLIGYTVMTEGDVQEVEDGWVLGAYDGLQVGVYLDSWRRRFGERMTVTPGLITIDVSPEQDAANAAMAQSSQISHGGTVRPDGAAPAAPPRGAILNLDPTITPAIPSGICNLLKEVDSGEDMNAIWAACHGDTDTQADSACFSYGEVCVCTGDPDYPFAQIIRTVVRFPVQGINPLTATLHIGDNVGGPIVVKDSLSDGGPLNDTSLFGALLVDVDGLTMTDNGDGTEDVDILDYWRISRQGGNSYLTLGLMHGWDAHDYPGDDSNSDSTFGTICLNYTMAASPCRMALTGAGG